VLIDWREVVGCGTKQRLYSNLRTQTRSERHAGAADPPFAASEARLDCFYDVAMNVVIGLGMLITPESGCGCLRCGSTECRHGERETFAFTEVVDTRKHQVRLAAKHGR
jgi:hypothetical protein